MGCKDNGTRGFNVAAINRISGKLVEPIRNFDTWGTGSTGTAMNALISFLNGLPDGTLVMIAAADEAGLTQFPPQPCTLLPYPWVELGIQRLEALGSTQIRNYCYWDSWAMAAVKGQSVALQEERASGVEVSVQTTVILP